MEQHEGLTTQLKETAKFLNAADKLSKDREFEIATLKEEIKSQKEDMRYMGDEGQGKDRTIADLQK